MTLVDRHPALRGVSGAFGLLPGRIHIQIQPAGVQEQGFAVLSAAAAGGQYRPSSAGRTTQSRWRSGGSLLNFTQAATQYARTWPAARSAPSRGCASGAPGNVGIHTATEATP